MRPKTLVYLAAIALAGCGGTHTGARSSPAATPSPLHACETRQLQLEGADVVLQANIDGTLGSLTIVHAPDRDAQTKAVDAIEKSFGLPRRDSRVITHQGKWGIPSTTDACGRPVNPVSPTPLPS